MATLLVKYEDRLLKSLLLGEGMTLTIGRSRNNDLVIENLAVSGHHAKIDCMSGKVLLTDLQSKNGTFVNEEIVQTCWLKDGDAITIGKHSLIFRQSDAEEMEPLEEDLGDKTLVLDTAKYQEMLEHNYNRQASEDVLRETIGVMVPLKGTDAEEIKLSKKLTRIGKDSASDIVIGGLFAGKIAATISRRPSGYHLSYVGGLSKPKVNGETVKQSVQLNDLDVVEIGSAVLQFHQKFQYRKES